MRITVVGLGKIGLPLAVQYAMKGHDVIGTDINPATVALINRAREPFPGETDLEQNLKSVIDSGHLRATLDTSSATRHSDAIVVVVPLFIDELGQPDFTAMDSATLAVGRGLLRGSLVCFETTLPVGTTRNRLAPILEASSGLTAGIDFDLVFSPERVFTGRVFQDLRKYPKIVGGINATSTARGADFYRLVLDFDDRPDLVRGNGVWTMESCEEAEMAKLAETTYRDVNIALANQFALYAEGQGMNVHEIIEAANSQPFSHIHKPGISVGGHCIPIYPKLYLWGDNEATLVKISREANLEMPERCIARLESNVGSLRGLRTVVLGAAYRGGVKETAFSGVFAIVAALNRRGALPFVHDPLYADHELLDLGLLPYHRGESIDVVILQTDHEQYREWSIEDVPGAICIFDGRNFTEPSNWRGIERVVLGRGTELAD